MCQVGGTQQRLAQLAVPCRELFDIPNRAKVLKMVCTMTVQQHARIAIPCSLRACYGLAVGQTEARCTAASVNRSSVDV